MPSGEGSKQGWTVLCLLLVAGCGSRTPLAGFGDDGSTGGAGLAPGSGGFGAGGLPGSGGVPGSGGLVGAGGTPGPLCPPGTYAPDPSGSACYPWSECSWDFPEIVPPSSTTDRLCAGPQPARQFGTGNSDEASDVAVDGLGNVYVTGHTYGDLDGPSHGDADAFVRKYSPQGALLWGYQDGRPTGDFGLRLALDAVGRLHVLVTGQYETQLWLLDLEGTVLSQQALLTGYVDLAVDPSGGRYVTRSFPVSDGTTDLEVTRLTIDGAVVWTNIVNGGGYEAPSALALLGGGDVIVTGSTDGSLFQPSASYGDAFVARLSAVDGSLVWGDQFTAGYYQTAPTSLAVDSQDNVYVAGITWSDVGSVSDGFVVLATAYGTLEWSLYPSTYAADEFVDIAVGPFDEATLTGVTSGLLGQYAQGGRDGFAAHILSYGYFGYVDQFGTSEDDFIRGIAFAPEGAWFVVGSTAGSFPGSTPAGGYRDAFVLRVPAF